MSEEQRKIFQRMDYVPDLSQEGEDLFESKKTAESLVANYLYNMESPNAFGVYGGWGSGKTTIMRGMEAKLKQDGHEENIIWFEPWKYEREDDLGVIFALLQQIAGEKFGKEIRAVLEGFLLTGVNVLLNASIQPKTIKENIETMRNEVFDEYEQWKSNIDNTKFAFQKIVAKKLGVTKREPDRIKEALLYLDRENKMIYIFLDDLDRCLPENVIKIFEVIKHFLAVEGVIFIIGADNAVIEHYIDKRYQSPDHRNFGQEYLDKVIPCSKELRRKDLKKFIELYFKEFDFEIDKEKKDQVISLLISFSNIRKVRHVLQEFFIVQKKVISRDSDSKLKDEDLISYFAWLIMKEFYSELDYQSTSSFIISLIDNKWLQSDINTNSSLPMEDWFRFVQIAGKKADLISAFLFGGLMLKDRPEQAFTIGRILEQIQKCGRYDELVYPQVFNVEINESLSLEENLTTS